MPQISVIMPIYNSEKYVAEAINSLLQQSFGDFEIIAINDGSKDHCGEVVAGIHDDRLVFINDPENHGFLPTLNRCISMARGKYIARLDDDDVAYPTRLEKQYEYMEAHPDVVLCGTSRDDIIEGEKTGFELPPIYSDEQFKFSLFSGNYCIPHSSFMMRKDALLDNGIRYEMFLQVPDYHMLTRMAEVGDIHFIRENLVGYRIHSSQSTAVRSLKMRYGELDRARLWYIHRLPIEESDKKVICQTAIRKMATKEDYEKLVDATIRYARICGLQDTEEDTNCIGYILDREFTRQRRCPAVLHAYRYARKKGIEISLSLTYWVKCLIGYNPEYIQSDYDEADDGSVDKHSV